MLLLCHFCLHRLCGLHNNDVNVKSIIQALPALWESIYISTETIIKRKQWNCVNCAFVYFLIDYMLCQIKLYYKRRSHIDPHYQFFAEGVEMWCSDENLKADLPKDVLPCSAGAATSAVCGDGTRFSLLWSYYQMEIRSWHW